MAIDIRGKEEERRVVERGGEEIRWGYKRESSVTVLLCLSAGR